MEKVLEHPDQENEQTNEEEKLEEDEQMKED